MLASAYTFLSPAASAMIAPAAPDIAAEFHIKGSVETALTVSIFVLAYGALRSLLPHPRHLTDVLAYSAFGPLLFAPLSEIYGRVRLLQSTNVLFLGEQTGQYGAIDKGSISSSLQPRMRFCSEHGATHGTAFHGGSWRRRTSGRKDLNFQPLC